MRMDTNEFSSDEDDEYQPYDSPLELWVDSASESQEHKTKTNSKLPPSLDIKNAWYLRKKKVEEDGEWKMYCDDEGRVIAQLQNTVMKKDIQENGQLYEIEGSLRDEMDLDKTNIFSANTGYHEPSSRCDSHKVTQNESDDSLIVLVNFNDGTDDYLNAPDTGKLSSSGSEASNLNTRTRSESEEDSIESRPNLEIMMTGFDEKSMQSYLNINPDSENNPVKESEMDNIIQIHLNEYPCVKNSWYLTMPGAEGILVDDHTVVNTHILVNDLRSFLKRNSIPLKVFSKEHLQRTQGTLSDLLNHPKDWTAMSERGREIYVKMMEFLSHPNLEQLVRALRWKLPARSTAEKLPQHILDCLSVGRMPSESDIAISAAIFPIDPAYLEQYCKEQIEIWNFEENILEMNVYEDMQCELNQNENTSDLQKDEEKTVNGSVVEAGSQTDMSSLAKKTSNALKYIDRHICTFPGCGAILNNRACFKAHMRHHAGIRLYTCMKCDKSFNTKSNLKMHMKSHYPESKDGNVLFSSRKTEDDGMPDNTELISNASTQTTTEKRKENLSHLKYICGVCWEGFKLRQHLQKHLCDMHNVSKLDIFEGFTCYVCSKSMKNISTLLVHMRIHTNDRPFECKQCKTGFHTRANLHRHMRVHTGEKPFKCPKCNATFTESKSAKVHMRKHTGEKPYKCPTCSKCFAQLSPLQMHLLIHQNKKPHLCELCGHSFRQKTNLQKHMLRHRGLRNHKCSQCEFAFLTKNDLQRHVLKHTGERPYKCELCKKSFTRLIYLRDHMKRQQGPTAPKCHYCNKKFCDDNARRKHLKLHSTADESVELSLHHTSALTNHIHQPSKLGKISNSSTMVQVHENASPVFLSTKAIFPNEKHYIITAIQSLDGCNEKNISDVATTASNLSDDTRSIILANNAESVILEGMNISGHHIPLTQGRISGILPQHNILFANDSVISSSSRSGRRMLSLAADDTDTVQIGRGNIVEESDPNMQSVVVETDDTMIIFSKSVHGN